MLQWLKWNNNENLTYSVIYFFSKSGINNVKSFSTLTTKKLTSNDRIGPHNIDIISIIIGSVLGDTHLEKRSKGIGTRIIFEQSNKNVEYLMWFHNYLSSRGYCNPQKPKLHTRIKKDNKVFYHYRLNSYTFSSFNWLHEMFYSIEVKTNKYIKIVPLNIEDYLTPLALATWFMDDGSKLGSGVRIATNCFKKQEVELLVRALDSKFNIKSTLHKNNNNYQLYIKKESIYKLRELVLPHMHKSMFYKLGLS